VPVNAGPIELLPGWRFVIAFEAGRSWCGWLYDPLGQQKASWIGKETADALVESAVTHLNVNQRHEEAISLRRHWEAIR
jgi:hypothetical protein